MLIFNNIFEKFNTMVMNTHLYKNVYMKPERAIDA
jgi:hypothetical protein